MQQDIKNLILIVFSQLFAFSVKKKKVSVLQEHQNTHEQLKNECTHVNQSPSTKNKTR